MDRAPSREEIREEMYRASDWNVTGKTDVPGMNYEEGVEAALRWVLDGGDRPIENESGEDGSDEEEDEED